MATLQFRRGSTANLQNIVPAAGEPIWDKQLQKLKVGDGISEYKDLPYVGDETVDELSIIFNGDHDLAINGYEEAAEGSSPVKSASGLNWVLVATKADIEEIKAIIGDENSGLIKDLEDLAAEVDNVKEDVDSIKDNLIEIHEELDEHDDRLDAIEETLHQIDPERIEEALETIEQVDDRLDDLEADVGDHETRIQALESKEQEQDTKLSDLEDRVEALEQNDQVQDTELADHEERIAALEEGGGGIDPDDIFIIYGGSADDVIIEAHDPEV